MGNKKSWLLIGLGSINILHAGLHLVQFIQSVMLVTKQSDENPLWSLLWASVGLLTLYVGVKDFKHHNHCHDDKVDKPHGH